VKHKVRPREPPLKRRVGASRRILLRRPGEEATAETVAGEAGVTEELKAELMVTRICDGILGRLNRNEACDDMTKTQRPRRRTR
jgi:hypothetical protein